MVACAQKHWDPPGPSPLLPRVVPLPGTLVPVLHELSLWDLVRLLKVTEDMSGVEGFPQIRTEMLLRYVVRHVSSTAWASASAGDAAALHALVVYFADRGAAGAAASPGAPAAGSADSAGGMELARIRNICKQHFCPAIIALVGARAWPAVAVSDILYTLAPRNLLTGAAAGAVLQWMAAAEAEAAGAGGEPISLVDTVDLLLGLAACPEVYVGEEEGSAGDAGGTAASASRGQCELDALFRACAPRLSAGLLALEAYGAAAAASSSAAAPTPLPTLAALGSALCDRFGRVFQHSHQGASAGSGELEEPLEPELAPLLKALALCARARLAALRELQLERERDSSRPRATAAAGAGAFARQPSPEGAAAAQALSLGRSLACLGLWCPDYVGALCEEWDRLWGRPYFSALLPPAAAADALFLASLSAARGGVPPFPVAPLRLRAEWNETGKILFLLTHPTQRSMAQRFYLRPLLPRPSTIKSAAESAFGRAFAEAWEECRAAAPTLGAASGSTTAAAAAALRHGVSGEGPHVTPEGCVVDIAIAGASHGVRLVRGGDLRPSRAGLKASLLAEQDILEAAGWTVEYILEADVAVWSDVRLRTALHTADSTKAAHPGLAMQVAMRLSKTGAVWR